MRVHRLEITAFGPFPDTEVIDFDSLNEAGFFLLTGPTGAGKTSILDAICFGLYGAVPGVRNNAKDLKSHHAPPRVQPVVELEVTLRDRRFRFRRTPTWRRPSSRAKVGYVDENASVQAAEFIDDEWVSRGTRLDEVGLLITRVLGMSKEQFCQVVMLPQGQFETFLRSGAKERHDVLEALFHTGRFQQIEKWLTDHRRQCDQASRQHEDQIQLLLARIEEANGARWYDDEATPHEAAIELGRRQTRLESATEAIRQQLDTAANAAKRHEHAVSEAELLVKRQTEYAEAERQLHELESLRETVHERERNVTRARLADKLTPQLTLLDDCAQQHLVLVRAADAVLERAVSSGALASPDDAGRADECAQALRTRIAELTAAREIDDAVIATTTALAETQATLKAASGTLAESEQSAQAIPAVLAAARVELDAARRNAARLEGLELRHRDASKVHHAAAALPVGQDQLNAARDAERLAHDRHLAARSALVDIREARISSMAAHLASQLTPGAQCPVCGNLEHPRPAQIDAAHVTEVDEGAASLAAQTAADLHAAARAAAAHHQSIVSALTEAAGGVDEPTAAAALTATIAAIEGARAAAEIATELQTRITELEQRQVTALATTTEQTRARSALVAKDEYLQADLAALQARRSVVLPDGGTVKEALVGCHRQLTDLDDWRGVCADRTTAEKSLAKQRSAFDEQLLASPFSDIATLRSAIMTAPEIAAAEGLNRAYAERRAITAERLLDPHLIEAAQAESPDLPSLRADAQVARTNAEEIQESYRTASRRRERLADLIDQLQQELDDWEPLRVARDRAVDVAAMCAGTSPDNQTRTKLSHYVLGARLQQVVDAANIRLLSISSGRYQLLHTMLKGVGDTRGGLGLRVLDTYTGQERDPATLSGGETFYVSLALALGLADLVRDEIGGTELSTLFVDEGFGSLDADTLDEVLDEVDSLRSGGRCVGLVSHLSELRRRIPTQVRIVPSTRGSKVSPS